MLNNYSKQDIEKFEAVLNDILVECRRGAKEAPIQLHIWNLVKMLFPEVKIEWERRTNKGTADIYCHKMIIETKKPGLVSMATKRRRKTRESPKDQALRYLNAIYDENPQNGLKACITDGRHWEFYDYENKSGTGSLKSLRGGGRICIRE